jgi:hypothetical protein
MLPRAKLKPLTLTRDEQEQLVQWAGDCQGRRRLAMRARIVLSCQAGFSNRESAKRLKVTVQTVGKWRARFIAHGMQGLADQPRSGAPRSISDALVEAFFVTSTGPVREARFKYLDSNTGVGQLNFFGSRSRATLDLDAPDGSVHDLFTIAGRTDAPPGCTARVLPQPDFNQAQADNNLALRIPTPMFGLGLIETISDYTILHSFALTAPLRAPLGILGSPNRSGNDGTITRFGWKAQNKSGLMFAGEAYNVEMGITNELFPNERGFGDVPPPAACLGNLVPEDETNFLPIGTDTTNVPSDIEDFSIFMRFLDQPTPACTITGPAPNCSPSIQGGLAQFKAAGCALCHTPSMRTDASDFTVNPPGLSNVQANVFSDLLLHHMGEGLNDGITQGAAGPDQFRTAPLWGIGQRLFFLHDGRTSDLLAAIRAHASRGSEANGVIRNFNELAATQQQNLLNFLRSL